MTETVSASSERRSPGGSSPARIEKYQAERSSILRAAFRLIGHREQAVSVQEILDEAGLSTRAFYRHFKSKDALILTMYRTAAERVDEELRTVAREATDPIDGLTSWISQQLAVVYDPRRARQATVLTSVEARSAMGFDQVHQEAATVRRAALSDLLRAGQRSGDLPGVTDPDEDARAVIGALGALIDARLDGQPTPEWAEATKHLAGVFLRAFSRPE